jgi:hypothetical protein
MMRLIFSKNFDDIKTGKGRYTFWNEFKGMISPKEKNLTEYP